MPAPKNMVKVMKKVKIFLPFKSGSDRGYAAMMVATMFSEVPNRV